MLRTVPHRITNRVQELLLPEGFKRRERREFVKQWKGDWIALISIDGGPYSLSPKLGVCNADLLRLHVRALKSATNKPVRYSRGGPPMISANLEKLVGSDASFQRYVSWKYRGDDRDPGPELETRVADDVVHCVREKGFPFFDAHVTFESVVASLSAQLATAHTNYFTPIILLKLGRRAEAVKFAEDWCASDDSPGARHHHQRYMDALIQIFDDGGAAP